MVIVPLLGAANHDPDVFEHPELFDIGRKPNRHLGFGHGVHFCLGAHPARIETKIALRALLGRYSGFAFVGDEPTFFGLIGFLSYEALPVRVTK